MHVEASALTRVLTKSCVVKGSNFARYCGKRFEEVVELTPAYSAICSSCQNEIIKELLRSVKVITDIKVVPFLWLSQFHIITVFSTSHNITTRKRQVIIIPTLRRHVLTETAA